MISKIFIPKRLSDAVERANEECKRRGLYQTAKCDIVMRLYRNAKVFGIDVNEAVRSAVVANEIIVRYVGLDVTAKQNEGVIISAFVPKYLYTYAREQNALIEARRSIRMWQVALKIFEQLFEKNSDDEVVQKLIEIAEKETAAAARIAI